MYQNPCFVDEYSYEYLRPVIYETYLMHMHGSEYHICCLIGALIWYFNWNGKMTEKMSHSDILKSTKFICTYTREEG